MGCKLLRTGFVSLTAGSRRLRCQVPRGATLVSNSPLDLVCEIGEQLKELNEPVGQVDHEQGGTRSFGFDSRQETSLVVFRREDREQPLVEEDEGEEDDGGGEPVEDVLKDLEGLGSEEKCSNCFLVNLTLPKFRQSLTFLH